MKRTLWLSILAGSMGVMNVAVATDDQPGAAAPEAPAPVAAPVDTGAEPFKWSNAEIENVGNMLVGTWKTAEPVKQGDGAASTDVVMSLTTVKVKGLPDTLYVETSRADALNKPYRQAIFQIFKYKSGLRLRTFEFRTAGIAPALVALHQAPELFPELKSDDLIATLDLDLKADGKGFSGKTAHPYPTIVGGALEMTSELHFGADSIESADRGYGADGKIVWGSDTGAKYTFKRSASPYKVQKLEGGLVAIDFVEGTEGEALAAGDKVAAHYTGWNKFGIKFDSSIDRGQPLVFTQGQLIAGWNVGLLGAKQGTTRRLVIPSAMGYGEQGRPPVIPSNSTLYFDVEVKSVEKPVPPPPADAAGQPTPAGPTDRRIEEAQPAGKPVAEPQPAAQPK
jgi:hypothetical protein